MGLTLRGVAAVLGIARNTAGNYSLGVRFDNSEKGEIVEVPKHILLACSAVENKLSPVQYKPTEVDSKLKDKD